MKVFGSLLILCISLVAVSSAQAYFVRPVVQQSPGGTIDGIEENGATQRAENFGTAFQSSVNLGTGSISLFLQIPAANQGGQAFGSFGDTLSFDNATGTQIGFNFAFDGVVNVTPTLPGPIPETLSISIFSNLFVYEAGSGATFANFTSQPGALVAQSKFDQTFTTPGGGTPTDITNQPFSDVLSGSVLVGSQNSFDVFASLSVAIFTNDNPVAVTMDFLDTGTFGIMTDPGVTFTSESGVFLTQTSSTSVPEPGTLGLFAAGLAMLGFLRRRRTA